MTARGDRLRSRRAYAEIEDCIEQVCEKLRQCSEIEDRIEQACELLLRPQYFGSCTRAEAQCLLCPRGQHQRRGRRICSILCSAPEVMRAPSSA
jgi:hypothetical protein